jgi:hypothetical protein
MIGTLAALRLHSADETAYSTIGYFNDATVIKNGLQKNPPMVPSLLLPGELHNRKQILMK